MPQVAQLCLDPLLQQNMIMPAQLGDCPILMAATSKPPAAEHAASDLPSRSHTAAVLGPIQLPQQPIQRKATAFGSSASTISTLLTD
jgi:hypothetical protein